METMEKREQLGSRLGFIMLSAGCAIGCGNVWKFPWMCGQNGGGSFMLVYVICLLILGLPAMVMELSVGRAAQTSPLYMYEKLSGKRKWKIPGIVCLIGNIALIAFYSVVAGWIIYYFVKFLTGQNADLGFEKMITTPSVNVGYLLITVVITFVILSFRLQGGLERITKYMMSALLVLMLVLVLCIAYLVIGSTVIAQVFQTIAIQNLPTSEASVILSTECIFAMLVSVIFTGETLTVPSLCGFALIFGAILLSEIQLPSAKRQRGTTEGD